MLSSVEMRVRVCVMVVMFIGAARILSGGALFLAKNVDLFLVVALKDRLNIPQNLTRPAKTVL